MSPPNKVDQLPPEILAQAQELLRGGSTVDEILDKLRELGADVSRSGVGRWKKGATKSMKSFQRTQVFAATMAKSLKEDPEGKMSRVLIELGNTALLDRVLALADNGEDDDETKSIDEKALWLLSSAVKNFASASNMNVARELKIRTEVIAKEQARALKAVEEVAATEGGWSAETLKKLRAAIVSKAA